MLVNEKQSQKLRGKKRERAESSMGGSRGKVSTLVSWFLAQSCKLTDRFTK